ncbi:MAG: ABC transporter permease [Flexilinea sp.]
MTEKKESMKEINKVTLIPDTEDTEAFITSASEEKVSVASNWKLVWWRFRKNRLAVFSLFLLVFVLTIIIFPDFYANQNSEQTNAREAYIPIQKLHIIKDGKLDLWVEKLEGARNKKTLAMEWITVPEESVDVNFFGKGMSWKFLFWNTERHFIAPVDSSERIFLLGSDRMGRDQWSRLMYATRTSLTVGMVSVLLSVLLGVVLGGISGYFGGTPDMIIQRLIEILNSVPYVPIWMAMAAALPRSWSSEQRFFAITVILSLLGWTTLGREVRGKFLAIREEDFVLAAELIGCSKFRIIFSHMVPTFLSHIIATGTLAIPAMIVNETSLSFLGLGLRPPAISYGVMLQEAQNVQTMAKAPWLMIPGLVVVIAVLMFNLVGDGLRDAADPYSK